MKVKPSLPELQHDHPMNRGLGAFWPMHERGGTDFHDISVNKNHGVGASAITGSDWLTTEVGAAIRVGDASNAQIEIPASASLHSTTALSVIAIIQTTDTWSSFDTVINQWNGDADRWWMGMDGTNGIAFQVNVTGSGVVSVKTSAVNDGRPHVIVGVWDGANISVWLDGVMEASSAATGTLPATQSRTWIGEIVGLDGFRLDQDVIAAGILTRALDASEARDAYVNPWGLIAPKEDAVAAAGGLLVPLQAAADGTSTVTGDLLRTNGLIAATDGTSTVAGDLLRTNGLAAASDGTSSVVIDLTRARGLVASANGTSTVAGDLSSASDVPLQAVADGTSTVAGDLLRTNGLAAATDGTSSVVGDLLRANGLIAASDGTSTVAGDLSSGVAITLTLNANRTTILAGETVHFDTVGTTSSMTSKPFHHIYYSWDSQDSSNVDQTGYGPVWAHVFRDPGTYLVAIEARDRHGNVTTDSVTITVRDPDTVYSTTKTVVVSTDGVFTGKPTGATEVTTSDWATAIASAGRDKRLLFKKGQTWTTTAGAAVNTSTGTDPALIGAWSSGADPIVDWTATPTGAANYLSITGGNIAIGGLDFRYTGATHTQQHISIAQNGSVVLTNVSVYDCKSDKITAPMPQFADSGAGATHSYIGIHRHVCTNTDGAADWMASFQGGDYYALIHNDVDVGGHHIIRHTFGSYACFFDNDFRTSYRTDKHHIKVHARTYSTAADVSRYICISKNRYQTSGNAIKVAIGPQNAAVDERVQDIIVDGDKVDVSSPQYGYGHFFYGVTDATYRNVVVNGKTQTDFYGAGVGQRGVEPAPTGIELYHQTLYSTGASGNIYGVEVGTVGATPVAKNFIINATAATTAAVASGTVTGGGSLVGDAKFTNPATEDFSLQATSTALDNGVVVDVVNSFNGAWRIVNGGDTADSGAYEEAGTGVVGLAAVADGSSTVSGAVSASLSLQAAADGLSTVAGILSAQGEVSLQAAADGSSGVTGDVLREVGFLAVSDGTSSVTAPGAAVSRPLKATADGTATVTAVISLQGEVPLSGAADGTSSVFGRFAIDLAISASSDGTSSVTGNLTASVIGAKSLYLRNRVLDHSLGTSDMPFVSTVYIALFPTDPGGVPTGELAGNGYARISTQFRASVGGSTFNIIPMDFNQATDDWNSGNDIGFFGVMDAPSGGNMHYHGPILPPVQVLQGQALSFESGDLVIDET